MTYNVKERVPQVIKTNETPSKFALGIILKLLKETYGAEIFDDIHALPKLIEEEFDKVVSFDNIVDHLAADIDSLDRWQQAKNLGIDYGNNNQP